MSQSFSLAIGTDLIALVLLLPVLLETVFLVVRTLARHCGIMLEVPGSGGPGDQAVPVTVENHDLLHSERVS